jgi:hypothetical protein
MRRIAILTALLITLALAAACGGDGNGSGADTAVQPVRGNSELVVGSNRFAVALIDAENNPILGDPSASVRLQFIDPEGEPAGEEPEARFVWAIPDVTGFWVADATFDTPGAWRAEATLTRDGEDAPFSVDFTVVERASTPKIGDRAPATNNLTLAQEPNISRISTDDTPDESYYQLTVAEALQAGKPFVVIFATPAFCQTRFCGPMLDNVDAVHAEFADQVNFIHIEPYELDAEGQLVTSAEGGPVPAQPTTDWGLQTEPWVFVVGADGVIADRFEGAASTEELRASIQRVVG